MELFELIAYGFLFLAFLLFNWVSQRAKRRRLERQRIALEKFRQQPGGLDAGDWGRSETLDRPAPAVRPEPVARPVPVGRPEPRRGDTLGPDWGREPEKLSYEALSYEVPTGFRDERPVVVPRTLQPPAPAQQQRQQRQRRPQPRILRTPKDLRDAVVAMTVLGPCRALQPYDAGGMDAPPIGAPRRGVRSQ